MRSNKKSAANQDSLNESVKNEMILMLLKNFSISHEQEECFKNLINDDVGDLISRICKTIKEYSKDLKLTEEQMRIIQAIFGPESTLFSDEVNPVNITNSGTSDPETSKTTRPKRNLKQTQWLDPSPKSAKLKKKTKASRNSPHTL